MINYNQFINEKKYIHKKLSKKFWNDNLEFNKRIRKKLLEITNDFYDNLDINFEIYDIHLTGSIANYNYNENSDLDIHIILDINEKNKINKKIFDNYLKSKAFIWNLKHNITIKGSDVELYIMDKNDPHISTGIYSLMDDKWIKTPKRSNPIINDDIIKSKFQNWVYVINKLTEISNNKNLTENIYRKYFDKSEKLKDKLRKFRKKGLHDGDGEFSVENLTFKKLRNEDYIEKLYNASTKFYELIFSQ